MFFSDNDEGDNYTRSHPPICECDLNRFSIPKTELVKKIKPKIRVKSRGPVRHNKKGKRTRY